MKLQAKSTDATIVATISALIVGGYANILINNPRNSAIWHNDSRGPNNISMKIGFYDFTIICN